jgi:hypothetical protein
MDYRFYEAHTPNAMQTGPLVAVLSIAPAPQRGRLVCFYTAAPSLLVMSRVRTIDVHAGRENIKRNGVLRTAQ